jgi:hypothetical protein
MKYASARFLLYILLLITKGTRQVVGLQPFDQTG